MQETVPECLHLVKQLKLVSRDLAYILPHFGNKDLDVMGRKRRKVKRLAAAGNQTQQYI